MKLSYRILARKIRASSRAMISGVAGQPTHMIHENSLAAGPYRPAVGGDFHKHLGGLSMLLRSSARASKQSFKKFAKISYI